MQSWHLTVTTVKTRRTLRVFVNLTKRRTIWNRQIMISKSFHAIKNSFFIGIISFKCIYKSADCGKKWWCYTTLSFSLSISYKFSSSPSVESSKSAMYSTFSAVSNGNLLRTSTLSYSIDVKSTFSVDSTISLLSTCKSSGVEVTETFKIEFKALERKLKVSYRAESKLQRWWSKFSLLIMFTSNREETAKDTANIWGFEDICMLFFGNWFWFWDINGDSRWEINLNFNFDG